MGKNGEWKKLGKAVRDYVMNLVFPESKTMFDILQGYLWDEHGPIELTAGEEKRFLSLLLGLLKMENNMLQQKLVVPAQSSGPPATGPVMGLGVNGNFRVQRKAKALETFDGTSDAWEFCRILINEWNRVQDLDIFSSLLPDMVTGGAAAWLSGVAQFQTLEEYVCSFLETFVGISDDELMAVLFMEHQKEEEEDLAFLERLILRAMVINTAIGHSQLGDVQVLVAFKNGVRAPEIVAFAQTSVKNLRSELLRRKRVQPNPQLKRVLEVEAVTESTEEKPAEGKDSLIAQVAALVEKLDSRERYGGRGYDGGGRGGRYGGGRDGYNRGRGRGRPFQGQCYSCGRYGHSQRYCRTNGPQHQGHYWNRPVPPGGPQERPGYGWYGPAAPQGPPRLAGPPQEQPLLLEDAPRDF